MTSEEREIPEHTRGTHRYTTVEIQLLDQHNH